jgi:hypothetical protein
MEDFDYFTYGTSSDPGPRLQYALYHPIFKCFLILTQTRDLAWELKSLLSSRYLVDVVCISSAENYSASMIDNTCCENWTIENYSPELMRFLSTPRDTMAQHLLPVTCTINFDVEKEKKWALMCLYWLRVFDIDLITSLIWFSKIDFVLGDIMDLDILGLKKTHFPYESIKEIKKILYLETDIVSAEQSILDIIKKSPTLTRVWNRSKTIYHV